MFICDECGQLLFEDERAGADMSLCVDCNDAGLEEESIDKKERDKWQG